MKRALPRLLCIILIVTLVTTLLLPVSAFAVETTNEAWTIQLNGKNIELPNGKIPFYDEEEWELYVPFRALYEAIGADVRYDGATRTVSAVFDDAVISFKQDGTSSISVVLGEDDSITYDLYFPIVTINDSVYVPYSILYYTTDLLTGCDYDNNALIVIDAATLIEGRTSKFTILEKLLKMETKIDGNFTGKGTLDLDVSGNSEEFSGTLPVDATLDFISSGTVFDMSFDVKANLSAFLGESIPGISAEMTIGGEILMNLDSGLLAFKSDALASFIDPSIEAGTWITADLSDDLDIDLSELEDISAEQITTDNFVELIYQSVLDNQYISSVDDYELLKESLDLVDKIFSDDAFIKTGNNYTSTANIDENGVNATIAITVKTDSAGNAVGATLKFDIEDETMTMSMSMDMSATTISMKISMSDEEFSMSMLFDFSYTSTTKSPRIAVPSGAKTIDINDIG